MPGAALMVQQINEITKYQEEFINFINVFRTEFNRISVEVLSVVSVQVKSILNAIKTKLKRFNFMGEEISLIPTIGMFITMNPGKQILNHCEFIFS